MGIDIIFPYLFCCYIFIPLPTTADKSLSYQHLDLWLPVSSLLSLNIPDPYNGSYALTMESLEILPDSLLLILEMIFILLSSHIRLLADFLYDRQGFPQALI